MFSFGVEIELIHVKIFESKIECLRRKVSNDIDPVAPPERPESFLSDTSLEAINDALVLVLEFGVLCLGLEEQFDALDGGSGGLGDDAGDASCEEVEDVEMSHD